MPNAKVSKFALHLGVQPSFGEKAISRTSNDVAYHGGFLAPGNRSGHSNR